VARRPARLGQDDLFHLHKIISAGDHPAAISKALGGRALQCDPLACDRIKFPRQKEVNRELLGVAIQHYQAELCDFMMAQEMDRNFALVYASDRDWPRAIELFRAHPDFVVHYAPDNRSMWFCTTRRSCLGIVAFNQHYEPYLATIRKCQPDALLEGLLLNNELGDKPMAAVLEGLFEAGATVRQEQIAAFSQSHPEYRHSSGMLQRRLEETKPKSRSNSFVRAYQRLQTFAGRS
jgi:hypothetical protein